MLPLFYVPITGSCWPFPKTHLVGRFTHPGAFSLAGRMAFAYFMGHAPRGFLPVLNGGNLAILYCFVFLYLSAAGPGPLSLDAKRARA